ncbi:uncharacterized protein LDX57_011499 [Aspergillus melleus]|uniref:uncharacterized protein n=1 Tax=Aspergillus melleus TaxID=138277 RepID=UPI001E8E4BA2|nr:uncharacterized protein LDX57_011499 [Aspergillus melleus]KAH8433862.1 hypothetical protein LDX57_011499 [Aspergillus melleus]
MNTILNPKALLCAFGVIGFLGTHGRTGADGSTALISNALESPNPYNLPGTHSALHKTFTGLPPVDFIISMLVLFWWETIDGSHPATSAIGLYFLGQLLPCIVITYLNALRGNKPSLVKPTLWLTLFQIGSVGATSFIWALAYTMRSPTTHAILEPQVLQISSLISCLDYAWLLVPALLLGYVLPAFLMGLPPTLVSNTFTQYALAAWNMYPAVVSVLLYLLRTVFARFIRRPAAEHGESTLVKAKSPTREAETSHLHAVRVTTIATLVLSSTMHLFIVGLSITTLLFPSIFKPAYVNELSPRAIFIPPVAPGPRALTPGDGVRGFLLWDQVAGYSTVLLVVLLELRGALKAAQGLGSKAPTPSAWIIGALGVGLSLVLGPGSACLVASWARDEILFGNW